MNRITQAQEGKKLPKVMASLERWSGGQSTGEAVTKVTGSTMESKSLKQHWLPLFDSSAKTSPLCVQPRHVIFIAQGSVEKIKNHGNYYPDHYFLLITAGLDV